jgi:hypothetical protein
LDSKDRKEQMDKPELLVCRVTLAEMDHKASLDPLGQ